MPERKIPLGHFFIIDLLSLFILIFVFVAGGTAAATAVAAAALTLYFSVYQPPYNADDGNGYDYNYNYINGIHNISPLVMSDVFSIILIYTFEKILRLRAVPFAKNDISFYSLLPLCLKIFRISNLLRLRSTINAVTAPTAASHMNRVHHRLPIVYTAELIT